MSSNPSAYRQRPAQHRIAAEGFPFIAIGALAALLLWLVGLPLAALSLLPLVAFTIYFFRNPERFCPEGEGLVVAPADGRVLSVVPDVVAPVSGARSQRVAIFMSVFNVHINRFPVAARVVRIVYDAGKFFVASLDKACEHNERNTMVLQDERGRQFTMVQIAGVVARRIVCYLREGDRLPAGERFGLIRFGSRVDLYLPPEARVEVKAGDRTRAGETIIGRLS